MQRQRERNPLTATEPLPRLRSDLQIIHKPKGAQVAYTLVKPSGDSTFDFDLYEVEYAVAKSFDGARSAIDISADLRGQGIVVGVEQVLSFFRELRGMGFVEPPVADDAEEATVMMSPAGDRDRFVTEGRQRLASGQPEYAEQYFLAALELDSGCVEAIEGLEEVKSARERRQTDADSEEEVERTTVDPTLFMDEPSADGAVLPSYTPPVGQSPPAPRSLPHYYPTPSQLHTPSFGYAPVPLPSFGTNPGHSNPGYSNPGYSNPGYSNPGFGGTNPGFGGTNPGFGGTNPGFGGTNPGFDPVTGQQTGPIPLPMAPPPVKQTSSLVLVALGASITVVGILIGYILFSERGGDGEAPRAAAADEPAPARATETPEAVAEPSAVPAADAAPAAAIATAAVADAAAEDEASAPAAVTVAVTERSQPVIAQVKADEGGTVVDRDADAGATVRRGSALVTVRVRDSGRSRKVRQLQKRVDELEVLAKEDPVYEDFLDRARADLRVAQKQPRSRRHEIEAPAAGVFRPGAIGKRVREGQTIGTIVDGESWQLRAETEAQVAKDWSCRVQQGERSAPCTLSEVERRGGQRRIVATVASEDAPWLGDDAELVLAPRTNTEARRANASQR